MNLSTDFVRQLDMTSPQPWLTRHRRELAAQFTRVGVPSPRQEDWKYTSLKALQESAFEPASDQSPTLASADVEAFAITDLDCYRLVFVNGRFVPELSAADNLPTGVEMAFLSSANTATLALFRDELLRNFDADHEALAALNGAQLSDGVLLRVAPGLHLSKAIQILSIGANETRGVAVALRNIVRVGEGAAVHLIERHVSLGNSSQFTNVVNQLRLAPGATMTHTRLQQDGDHGFLVTRTEVDQQSDSYYRYDGFDLGGRLVRHDMTNRLAGVGATCKLSGVYVLDARRHVDNHLRVDHVAPRSNSEACFKGVLGGRSRAVFNGKVVVHSGADGTDAAQTNANLLLSPHAEIDTKPELEIYADDVRCRHGATVGQVDAAQLFYLRSRGIAELTARQILTYAFCRAVVDRLGHEGLRDYLADRILACLPDARSGASIA